MVSQATLTVALFDKRSELTHAKAKKEDTYKQLKSIAFQHRYGIEIQKWHIEKFIHSIIPSTFSQGVFSEKLSQIENRLGVQLLSIHYDEPTLVSKKGSALWQYPLRFEVSGSDAAMQTLVREVEKSTQASFLPLMRIQSMSMQKGLRNNYKAIFEVHTYALNK